VPKTRLKTPNTYLNVDAWIPTLHSNKTGLLDSYIVTGQGACIQSTDGPSLLTSPPLPRSLPPTVRLRKTGMTRRAHRSQKAHYLQQKSKTTETEKRHLFRRGSPDANSPVLLLSRPRKTYQPSLTNSLLPLPGSLLPPTARPQQSRQRPRQSAAATSLQSSQKAHGLRHKSNDTRVDMAS